MGVGVDIELEGIKEISAEIGLMPKRIGNLTEPLRRSVDEIQQSIQTNFDRRGSLFESGGWKPRKDNKKHPLLEKTGKMRNNFDDITRKTEAMIFNNTPYFRYHQSNKPRTKLPRRVMMKIDEKTRNFILKELQLHFVKQSRWRR